MQVGRGVTAHGTLFGFLHNCNRAHRYSLELGSLLHSLEFLPIIAVHDHLDLYVVTVAS